MKSTKQLIKKADSQNELIIQHSSASTSALQQVVPAANTTIQNKSTSDRICRSPLYYGFERFLSEFMIRALPNQLRSAGDVENYQPTEFCVVETVQTAPDQLPDEYNISPVNGDVSPPDPRV